MSVTFLSIFLLLKQIWEVVVLFCCGELKRIATIFQYSERITVQTTGITVPWPMLSEVLAHRQSKTFCTCQASITHCGYRWSVYVQLWLEVYDFPTMLDTFIYLYLHIPRICTSGMLKKCLALSCLVSNCLLECFEFVFPRLFSVGLTSVVSSPVYMLF